MTNIWHINSMVCMLVKRCAAYSIAWKRFQIERDKLHFLCPIFRAEKLDAKQNDAKATNASRNLLFVFLFPWQEPISMLILWQRNSTIMEIKVVILCRRLFLLYYTILLRNRKSLGHVQIVRRLNTLNFWLKFDRMKSEWKWNGLIAVNYQLIFEFCVRVSDGKMETAKIGSSSKHCADYVYGWGEFANQL